MQVVSKAVLLLSILGRGRPKSVAELTALTEQPRTTVYRILGTLVARGWVEETSPRGHFRLGIGILATARNAVDHHPLRNTALPFMRSLRNRSGLTILLIVRNGIEALCIERMDGDDLILGGMQLGGSLPLHAGASPRVLLAFAGKATEKAWEAEARLHGQAASITPRTMVDIHEIKQRLPMIRERRFEVSNGDSLAGFSSIAAPVFISPLDCVAAITLAGTSEQVSDARKSGALPAGLIDVTTAMGQKLRAASSRAH